MKVAERSDLLLWIIHCEGNRWQEHELSQVPICVQDGGFQGNYRFIVIGFNEYSLLYWYLCIPIGGTIWSFLHLPLSIINWCIINSCWWDNYFIFYHRSTNESTWNEDWCLGWTDANTRLMTANETLYLFRLLSNY